MTNFMLHGMVVHATRPALQAFPRSLYQQLTSVFNCTKLDGVLVSFRVHTTVWEGTSNLETVAQNHLLR